MSEIFGWFGMIMDAMMDLFPRRVIVDTREGLVKFVRGRKIKACGPGIWWYWPFWTKIHQRIVAWQPIHLPDQILTTKDGVCCKVGAVFVFMIEDIVQAVTTNGDLDELIVNECMAAVQDIISYNNYEDIKNSRQLLKKKLTSRMRKSLMEYGVKVRSAALTEFCKTKALNISGITFPSQS